jgi:hypothetical protein
VVNKSNLRSTGIRGGVQSCGCLKKEWGKKLSELCPSPHTTNGQQVGGAATLAYRSYNSAKGRCTDVNCKDYKYYGARGIKFLFTSFEQFFAEIGLRPSPKHSLDRINNDGNYEPGNVKWSTAKEQRNNQRPRQLWGGHLC